MTYEEATHWGWGTTEEGRSSLVQPRIGYSGIPVLPRADVPGILNGRLSLCDYGI